MRRGNDDALGVVLVQKFGRGTDRAARVDHVIDQDTAATGNVTDDFLGLDRVLFGRRPTLVDVRKVGVEQVGVTLRDLHPTRVGRDDHHVLVTLEIGQIIDQHRHRREVVDRAVEEALNLAAVEVDRDESIGAGGMEEIGDESGGDRLTARCLAVLAAVAVEGRNGGDAFGRRPLGGVDHDEVLHDRVVDGATVPCGVGLHDEHVGATDRIAVFDVDLAVRELGDIRRALHDVEFSTDVGDELCGGSTCDNVQLLVIQELHPVPPVVPSREHPTSR